MTLSRHRGRLDLGAEIHGGDRRQPRRRQLRHVRAPTRRASLM
jgi:hypothetical protein